MKRRHLTRTIGELKTIVDQVMNFPHPGVATGQIYCTAIGGKDRDPDDSCVLMSPACMLDLTGSITLGKWVMIGAMVSIYTHEHPTSGRKPLLLLQEELGEDGFTRPIDMVIGDDVWINQSIILGKCDRIARGVVIGAGSVVTRPILEEYTIWAGVPARKIGTR